MLPAGALGGVAVAAGEPGATRAAYHQFSVLSLQIVSIIYSYTARYWPRPTLPDLCLQWAAPAAGCYALVRADAQAGVVVACSQGEALRLEMALLPEG